MTFNACEFRKCVGVRIVDDGVCEENEFFTYHLVRTANLDSRIELDPVDGRSVITTNTGTSGKFS